MAASTKDGGGEFETIGVEAADMSRYEDVQVENGEVIIYDRDVESAWIQSDSALGLEFMI
jgi:hypothetical protein